MVETIPNLTYGTVTGRFLAAVADSDADLDKNPDGVPLSGTIKFTPSVSALLLTASTPPMTVLPAAIVATLDDQGYISLNGDRGVNLIATDTQDTSPTEFTYEVSFQNIRYAGGPNLPYASFSINVPANQVTDLTLTSPVPSSSGLPVVRDENAIWTAANQATEAAADAAAVLAQMTDGSFAGVNLAVKGGPGQVLTPNTYNVIQMPTVDVDTLGKYDPATGLYTIPVTGMWNLDASLRIGDATLPTGANVGVGIDTQNGDNPGFTWHTTGAFRNSFEVSRKAYIKAGEKVRFFTYFEAGNSVGVTSAVMSLSLITVASSVPVGGGGDPVVASGRLAARGVDIGGKDLNTVVDAGWYSGSNLVNGPFTGGGFAFLVVDPYRGDDQWAKQTVTEFASSGGIASGTRRTWTRQKQGGQWSTWTLVSESTGAVDSVARAPLAGRLGPKTLEVGNADLNTVLDNGWYIAGGNAINQPGAGRFILIVSAAGDGYVHQRVLGLIGSIANEEYVRVQNGGPGSGWGGWTRVANVLGAVDQPVRDNVAALSGRVDKTAVQMAFAGTSVPTYRRIATITTINSFSGANLSVLFSGLGDYGSKHRGSALIHLGQREANAPGVTIHTVNAGLTSLGTFYTKQVSDFSWEFWYYSNAFTLDSRVTVLAQSTGTLLTMDSATTTAPTGLVAVTTSPLDADVPTAAASAGQVYAKNGASAVTGIGYATATGPNTLVQRDLNGAISIGKPSADDHATTKAYVDAALAAVGGPGTPVTSDTGATAITVPAASATLRRVLTGTAAISLPSNPSATSSYMVHIILKQDGTGSRLVTWPQAVYWPGGVVPNLSTAPNAIDSVRLLWTGTEWLGYPQGSAFGQAAVAPKAYYSDTFTGTNGARPKTSWVLSSTATVTLQNSKMVVNPTATAWSSLSYAMLGTVDNTNGNTTTGAPPVVTDLEAVFDYSLVSLAEQYPKIGVRVRPRTYQGAPDDIWTDGSGAGIFKTGYTIVLGPSGGVLEIARGSDTTTVDSKSGIVFPSKDMTWRIKVSGNGLYLRWWTKGAAEPTAWNYSNPSVLLNTSGGTIAFTAANNGDAIAKTVSIGSLVITTPVITPGPSQQAPADDGFGWSRIFTENFNTAAPVGTGATGFTNVYANSFQPYNDEGMYFPRAMISAHDGYMDVYMDGTRGSAGTFGTPANAYNRVGGKFSMRAMATDAIGNGTAVIVWPTSEVWAQGELDYPESNFEDMPMVHHHSMTPGSEGSSQDAATNVTWREWHVYSVEWLPGQYVRYLVDDKEIMRTETDVPTTEHRYMFQVGNYGNPGHLLIDWVTISEIVYE